MNVGFCTISKKEGDVEELIAMAGEVGFDGVEIWGQDHVGDGSPETCARIVDAAEDAGLDIPVYGSYLRAGDYPDAEPDPVHDLDVPVEGFENEIDHELAIADRLGADLIRVWAGRHDYVDVDEEYLQEIVADLEQIAERATDYGIEVTVEKHYDTATNDLEGARRVIEEVDRDDVGLNYQPTSGVGSEGIQAEAAELAPLTNHMHALAVHQRGTSDRHPYSTGDFDFEAMMETFADAGYDGYVDVEFVSDELPYEESVREDYEFVRSVIDGLE